MLSKFLSFNFLPSSLFGHIMCIRSNHVICHIIWFSYFKLHSPNGACAYLFQIDLFSLNVFFSHFRPRDVLNLKGNCCYAYICTCIRRIRNKLFSRVTSRCLKWENKTYKLKKGLERFCPAAMLHGRNNESVLH